MNPFWSSDSLPPTWRDHWRERIAILIENHTPVGEAEERATAEVVVLIARENQADSAALTLVSGVTPERVHAEKASRAGP